MADPEDRPADDERDGSAAGSADDPDAGGSDEDAPDEGPTDDDPTDDDATAVTGDGDREGGEDPAVENDVDADGGADSAGENDSAGEDATDRDEPETDEPETDTEPDDTEPEPVSALPPPVEPAPFVELMAAYRQPATAGAERLPWSWTTLSPAEKEAAAVVLDGFVESYNRTWAIGDDQTVPPCWHRHPALAHDLAALAWSYFQAYRDATATPDRALGFQAHLPLFAERVDRWLGANAADCRGGRHADPPSDRVAGARGTSVEDADAVLLLGREAFGFAPH